MASETSLEWLLQSLVSSPEAEKKAVTEAAVKMLREVCNLHINAHSARRDTAKSAALLLDQVLSGEVVLDEVTPKASRTVPPKTIRRLPSKSVKKATSIFAQPYPQRDLEEVFSEDVVTTPPRRVVAEDSLDGLNDTAVITTSPEGGFLHQLIDKWNEKVAPWFQIALPPDVGDFDQALADFVCEAACVRSNLASAVAADKSVREEIRRFDRYWKVFVDKADANGYEIFPRQFGRVSKPQGKIIYSSRPRIQSEETVIIVPGLKKMGNELVSPVTLVILPPEQDFPENHQDRDFPSHWRAILGELELLLLHLEMQRQVYCTIEVINKSNIEPYFQCRENVLSEVKRRANALRSAIKNEESIYRMATNYWRVEECFWSIFHGDERPTGYSFFDRLRKRLQGWRNRIRNENQLIIRDFADGDTLASVNKYIGNIVLQPNKEAPPGKVLRQLRPAIIVKVDRTTRLLKGRVCSS